MSVLGSVLIAVGVGTPDITHGSVLLPKVAVSPDDSAPRPPSVVPFGVSCAVVGGLVDCWRLVETVVLVLSNVLTG